MGGDTGCCILWPSGWIYSWVQVGYTTGKVIDFSLSVVSGWRLDRKVSGGCQESENERGVMMLWKNALRIALGTGLCAQAASSVPLVRKLHAPCAVL